MLYQLNLFDPSIFSESKQKKLMEFTLLCFLFQVFQGTPCTRGVPLVARKKPGGRSASKPYSPLSLSLSLWTIFVNFCIFFSTHVCV
jgi:hypothetical protein